jgi:hypothetical protein
VVVYEPMNFAENQRKRCQTKSYRKLNSSDLEAFGVSRLQVGWLASAVPEEQLLGM